MPSITSFREANLALERYWPKRLPPKVRSAERTSRLLEFLGNPQNKLRVVHIAGTSGKTSTAYYTASLLRASGHTVGLIASPHIDEVNERVQVNLTPLEEAVFCRDLEQFLGLVEQSGIHVHYFELMVAFALWEFARYNLDYAVVETGMGGLLDPTNTLSQSDKVCVVTDIGLDHTRALGTTLSEITRHKAGIIHLHNAVFCHRQSEEVLEVIRKQAARQQADLHILDDQEVAGLHTDFLPLFQQRNFALAYAAATYCLRRDGGRITAEGLEQAARIVIPGRMEVLQVRGKILVLDAAHNPQEMTMLAKSLQQRFGDLPAAALVAFAPGKTRATNMLRQLRPVAEHYIVTSFGRDAHAPFASISEEDAQQACAAARIRSVTYSPVAQSALDLLLARPEPLLLVSGSLFLLAEVRALLAGTI